IKSPVLCCGEDITFNQVAKFTVPLQNSKTYDATGCFVGLEAWGDVSSERAIVRTRNISCLKDGKTIDMPIKGHVSFRGKNGIKGEVV
ncbi:hypothetical protein OSL47_26555, partial [Escherichia coli]|nr:hypothetical protein [Escherichia coli]